MNYTNAQVKLKATVAQQTKLIDFLQDKTETPTKKQKKGKLFGGGSSNKQYKETQLLNLPMQVSKRFRDVSSYNGVILHDFCM